LDIPGHIVLFDGICILCNRAVKFILKHDRKQRIFFTPLQSNAGKHILKEINPEHADTIVYFRSGRAFTRSTAILYILKDIGRGWNIFFALVLVPRFIRDYFYDLVSKSRYRIFGRLDHCVAPGDEFHLRWYDPEEVK